MRKPPISTPYANVTGLTAGQLLYGSATGGIAQATAASLGASLILVERQTLAAAAQEVTFSGLAGDTDERYLLRWRILTADGTALVPLLWAPNGLSTNLRHVRHYNGAAYAGGGDGHNVSTDTAGWIAGHGNVSAQTCTGNAWIWAKTGARRSVHADVLHVTTQDFTSNHYFITWSDTTTEITSMKLVGNAANILGVGSVFELYKVR